MIAERKMESRETESRVDENNGECVTLEWHLSDPGTKTPLTLSDIYTFAFLSKIALSLKELPYLNNHNRYAAG